MKALRLHARGGPEQLVFEDAPVPEPALGEVRVRVHAAAITPTELTWNETYRHPDGSDRIPSIPCHDVSGVIDQLGPGASGFALGDAVYGLIDFPHDGSAAEYVVAPAATLARTPRTLNHLQSASVPLSALTAWQALFDHAQLSTGSRVLIHGAAGGVGAYAVQLARSRGIDVYATASSRHAPFLKEIGVNTFIDYTVTPFETVAHDLDAVIDTLGGTTRDRSWQTLRPGGTLVALTSPIVADLTRRQDVNGLFFVVRPNAAQLVEIAALIDCGRVRPFVAATYDLADGQAAFQYAATGHLSGKVVLRII